MFNRRILIIDHHDETSEAMKFIIESYGESLCDIACDAVEALNALRTKEYHLVMIDKMIPGLNGAKVLEQMDQLVDYDPLEELNFKQGKTVPVVLMSKEDTHISPQFPLKHFELVSTLNKSDLEYFLSTNFAN